MTQLISQAEFARRRGVTRQYVSKLVRLGKVELTPQKKIDYFQAVRDLEQNSDPARATIVEDPATSAVEVPADLNGSSSTFQGARTNREIANARKAELELCELEGRLIDKARVEHEVSRLFRELRQHLMRIPQIAAGRLVTLNNEREITAHLEEQLNAVLQEFSDQIVTPRANSHE